MQHEIYADKVELAPASTIPVAPEVQTAIDRAKKLAKLGLARELTAHQLNVGGLLEEQPLTVAPFDMDQYLVWRLFLDDTFSSDVEGSKTRVSPTNEWGRNDLGEHPVRSLAEYDPDAIPTPVLQIWDKALDSKLFERFEIWCRPVVQVERDPLLVGVRKGAFYPLARWGEDDANFLSFDDVVKLLHGRFTNAVQGLEGPVALIGMSSCAGIALSTVGSIAWAAGERGPDAAFVVLGIACLAFAGLVGLPWKNRLKARLAQDLFRSSATARAIAKFAKSGG